MGYKNDVEPGQIEYKTKYGHFRDILRGFGRFCEVLKTEWKFNTVIRLD
jgi:hypothetical protein